MPQISGIPVAKSVSICYLVFSIVDILLLFLFYEIALYTMKDFLNVNRYIAFVWGIAMVVLGILVIVIEIPLAKRDSANIWRAMSTNQRAFFANNIGKLAKTRGLNSMYVGIFTIVIGALFIAISATLFLLDRDLKQRIEWPTSSRLPIAEKHEQCLFKGMSEVTAAEFDLHHIKLRPYLPVKPQKTETFTSDLEKQSTIVQLRKAEI